MENRGNIEDVEIQGHGNKSSFISLPIPKAFVSNEFYCTKVPIKKNDMEVADHSSGNHYSVTIRKTGCKI